MNEQNRNRKRKYIGAVVAAFLAVMVAISASPGASSTSARVTSVSGLGPLPTETPTFTSTFPATHTRTGTPVGTSTGTPTNTRIPFRGYSDITTKPYGLPGVVSELTLHIWGVDSWRRGGDAYSPAFGAGSSPGGGYTPNEWHGDQPYGYLFKIDVPASYTYSHLLVELFDPDTYNKPGAPPTWPPTPRPVGTGTPTHTPVPPPSADQYASCSNPRPGACNSDNSGWYNFDTGVKLNAFQSGRPAFWRMDELRSPYTDTSGIRGVYNAGYATTTQYTLWHFDPHTTNVYADPSTISDQSSGAYLARYTTGWDPMTDLSWYRPAGFEVTLRDGSGKDLFKREQNGGFYFYIYVQGIAGSSRNNYDMRVGPPELNFGFNCSMAANCYVNQQNLDGILDWQDGGAKLYAKRALPLSMVFGDTFPLMLTEVSRDMAGQTLGIRHFDQDCGNSGCGSQMQYQMQVCSCANLQNPNCWANIALGWVGPNNAWVYDTHPDPEPVAIPAKGTPEYNLFFGIGGQCSTSWLRIQTNPSYSGDATVWEVPFLGSFLRR